MKKNFLFRAMEERSSYRHNREFRDNIKSCQKIARKKLYHRSKVRVKRESGNVQETKISHPLAEQLPTVVRHRDKHKTKTSSRSSL